jgi:hypothetical protein
MCVLRKRGVIHKGLGSLARGRPGEANASIGRRDAHSTSAKRLPVQFARKVYAAGESRMGGCVFTLGFRDGSKQSYSTGSLVDFLEMPDGKMLNDVIDLEPHKGDEQRTLSSLPYSWCLFGASERKALRTRIFKK